MTDTAVRPLLEARNLTKRYVVGRSFVPGSGRTVHAVENVSLAVRRGDTLGLVGESGSGKSTLGRCLTRLYDVTAGEILFDGVDIARADGRALAPVRRRMQMIFQDPSASLNPRRTVRDLIGEPLAVHGLRPRREIPARLDELMDLVGLPAAYLDRYPHEFSGGQRQRIGIARALAVEPELIVADEPVSALDVSVQAQIVNLFADLRERLGLTYVFIAHDLGVVRQVADRVAVMYLGGIVETGDTTAVFGAPAHPYTEALVSAIPQARRAKGPVRPRILLQGDLPSPLAPPPGCAFSTRCPKAFDRCRTDRPALTPRADGRAVACHLPG
ncbi:ABC transporter ATP-binding protein [Oharaeibacter diazotrophicus]|uniref:Peptide/nickel transport system ATP-binding protein n=1 Tax=Oharaeibacter diazotrophicus TaxID=1920512 RepID=A0A4R6RKU1_9HYPH|nr:oligopeptide/dipeptide ABC transporter ATP-binding protein [Oharaeibacter diazotrophicus]TDP86306.1 peptide/nickel transport system ATP-binding protein [Oharaeibacter diazotrophicus]BBE71751.1 oligopeptide transport ATP-binding protein OppF [Pleomorphomonas sp. SM30]GLS78517.1 ABC transporter ATP-binding protein [Oharaeibacter diazotrophicus]